MMEAELVTDSIILKIPLQPDLLLSLTVIFIGTFLSATAVLNTLVHSICIDHCMDTTWWHFVYQFFITVVMNKCMNE